MAQASERPRRKRLSWESRCEVVAAIEQGVSPPLAAARGGCSRATAYRLWRRYREGGWAALRARPSTPRRQPRRLSAALEQQILLARRRPRMGRCAWPDSSRTHPRPSARSCGGTVARACHGPAQLLPAALVAMSASSPASSCTSTRRSWGASGSLASASSASRRAGRRAIAESAGSTCTSRSTTTRDSPTPSCSGAGCRVLRSLPRARRRLVPGPRHRRRARADRQRQGLPRTSLGGDDSAARDRASLHTRLSPAHERQGRTLHPDAPARVGVRAQLSLERRSDPRPPRLPALVQPTSTAQLARSPASDQPRLTPLWS